MLLLRLISSSMLLTMGPHALAGGGATGLCEGKRAKYQLTFTIAAHMKPPVGSAVESAGNYVAVVTRTLNHLSKELPYFLMDATIGQTPSIFSYAYADFLMGKIAIRYPGARETDYVKRGFKIFSTKTDGPYSLVLCHRKSCKGLKDPTTGKEIEEFNEDETIDTQIAAFRNETKLDLSAFVSMTHAIPKAEQEKLCKAGGLKASCFSAKGILCEDESDWMGPELPSEPYLSCFMQKYLFYPSAPEVEPGNRLTKEQRATLLTFFLSAEASRKITTEQRGEWVIKRIVLDLSPLCRSMGNEKDLYVH
jgi:hypothetical protein